MNNERGFTLIEAMVATLVLTVGLLAMAELLAVSLRMHQLGRNSTTATRLAQDKFEEMMKMNFNTNPAIPVTNCASALATNVHELLRHAGQLRLHPPLAGDRRSDGPAAHGHRPRDSEQHRPARRRRLHGHLADPVMVSRPHGQPGAVPARSTGSRSSSC